MDEWRELLDATQDFMAGLMEIASAPSKACTHAAVEGLGSAGSTLGLALADLKNRAKKGYINGNAPYPSVPEADQSSA